MRARCRCASRSPIPSRSWPRHAGDHWRHGCCDRPVLWSPSAARALAFRLPVPSVCGAGAGRLGPLLSIRGGSARPSGLSTGDKARDVFHITGGSGFSLGPLIFARSPAIRPAVAPLRFCRRLRVSPSFAARAPIETLADALGEGVKALRPYRKPAPSSIDRRAAHADLPELASSCQHAHAAGRTLAEASRVSIYLFRRASADFRRRDCRRWGRGRPHVVAGPSVRFWPTRRCRPSVTSGHRLARGFCSSRPCVNVSFGQ